MNDLSTATDVELVEQYHLGNLDAFEVLVERWQTPLLRFAATLRRSPDLAEDAVQETFMRFLRAAPKSGSFESLGPWLFRVCRNHCYDVMKKETRGEAREVGAVAMPMPPTPDELAAGTEIGAIVGRELDLLPEKEREALRLKIHGGLCYREIAEVLGVAQGTVGWLVHQAMGRLSRRLGAFTA